MEIIYKNIKELKKYKNNPRINDESVKFVANSIKEFGFKVPIIIDVNNEIVCGHTRFEAAKKLKMEEIPCIIANDLNENQIKAFRLADNRVSEFSIWEQNKLIDELNDIDLGIDMSNFGFDFKMENIKIGKEKEKINDRAKTDNQMNLQFFDKELSEGKFDMPIIFKNDYIPKKIIGFNYCKSLKTYDFGVHFFIDDYQFERLWNEPEKYIDLLRNFDCVLSPDFSIYVDMPKSMQIWNVYRSRLLGQFWQNEGLNVIPTISWSDESSFEFCFDGIAKNSVVAISTVGSFKNEESKKMFYNGFKEMIKRLEPIKILVYGENKIDYNKEKIIYFKNEILERLKNGQK